MLLMAFSVVVLDYASQAAINPCESLVADINQGHRHRHEPVEAESKPATAGSVAHEDGFVVYSGMLR